MTNNNVIQFITLLRLDLAQKSHKMNQANQNKPK